MFCWLIFHSSLVALGKQCVNLFSLESEGLDKKDFIHFSTKIQLLNKLARNIKEFLWLCVNLKVRNYLIYYFSFLKMLTQRRSWEDQRMKSTLQKYNSIVPSSFSVPELDPCLQEPGDRNNLKVQLTLQCSCRVDKQDDFIWFGLISKGNSC